MLRAILWNIRLRDRDRDFGQPQACAGGPHGELGIELSAPHDALSMIRRMAGRYRNFCPCVSEPTKPNTACGLMFSPQLKVWRYLVCRPAPRQ